uniref:unconventional myosin-VIIa-like n=1 Tax=Styela clava TaxID=7725 RepID=UPI00193A66EE|nr:unconventional myosin-VIIa-like [Styela clava]
MALIQKGVHIWLPDKDPQSNCSVPLGAVVKEREGDKIQVLVDNEKEERWLDVDSSIKLMHSTSVDGVEDMIRLGDMNEGGILRNLLMRYNENEIYTYTGSILVAVNPYQILPLYEADQIRMYTNKQIGELPPHIFAIADNAYFNMQKTQKDQCVIVSGESGAGKTESTKFILQYLTSRSGQHSHIEEQLLKANPVLEAFGNAKTVRNDNSSRFGKFIKINFSKKGVIMGAHIEQYLVEKSRIVYQANGERNYHIFYCMLAGMSSEQKQKFGLGEPSDYLYLTRIKGSCLEFDGRDDKLEFENIVSGMKDLSISEDDINQIYKLLAAILHVGNFKFKKKGLDNEDDACELVHNTGVETASDLLGLNDEDFEKALTQRFSKMGKDTVTFNFSISKARDGKDALIKGLYSRIFIWIVNKINNVIHSGEKDKSKLLSIGLLDIFGFENFEKNGFEQLCINFANEKLQQFFVHHIFKLEQKEYNKEKIKWRQIDFTDNQEILDMIAIQKMNVLALITEETRFPNSTDQTLLDKLTRKHGENRNFYEPKSQVDHTFGIRHYAGTVRYNTNGFLERNRDSFNDDMLSLIQSSTNECLKSVFQGELNVSDRQKNQTLCVQFKKSLNDLVSDLEKCQPFFVRCIKPNEYKESKSFDRQLIARQLRYSGMMDTIRIRRDCYPIRYTFEEFINMYQVILRSTVTANDRKKRIEICNKIMLVAVNDEDWENGLDKIFLKDKHILSLEAARKKAITRKIIAFQGRCRGFVIRRHYKGLIEQRKDEKLRRAREQEELLRAKKQEADRKEREKRKATDKAMAENQRKIYLSELQKNRKQSQRADDDGTLEPSVGGSASTESEYKNKKIQEPTGKEQLEKQLQKVSQAKDMKETRAYYPISYALEEFAEKYVKILPIQIVQGCKEMIEICQKIMDKALDGKDWQIGENKIFLKDEHDKLLETAKTTAIFRNTLHEQGLLDGKNEKTAQATETFLVWISNSTCETFEVGSGIRAKDFCSTIANRHALKSAEGFSLFVRIAGNDVSVPDDDCFVEFVRDKTDNDSSRYQVIFMRKLWNDVVPGEDPIADEKFHYPQEVLNFLRSYHKCTKEEGTQLAALIYRNKYGEDQRKFAKIPQLLQTAQLLPKDLFISSGGWLSGIMNQFKKHSGMSKNDARISFLKIVSRWPTFGSSFFEVKQTTGRAYPENLLIAINNKGVSLIDKISKNILRTFPFSDIKNRGNENGCFSITVEHEVGEENFLFETNMGDAISDLLSSYSMLEKYEDTRL